MKATLDTYHRLLAPELIGKEIIDSDVSDILKKIVYELLKMIAILLLFTFELKIWLWFFYANTNMG